MEEPSRQRPLQGAHDDDTNRPGGESTGPDYLLIGRIIRPHGVRGEVAMKILTSYPEHLSEKETVYLGHTHTPYTIKRIRPHRKGMLIFFEGISDRDEAELLRDLDVFTDMENAVPLDEGEYYLYQIEGIRVVTDEGRELGHLTDFIETGANDVYIITNEDGDELLIPAIPDVILDIDIDEHVMTVHLLEGLID